MAVFLATKNASMGVIYNNIISKYQDCKLKWRKSPDLFASKKEQSFVRGPVPDGNDCGTAGESRTIRRVGILLCKSQKTVNRRQAEADRSRNGRKLDMEPKSVCHSSLRQRGKLHSFHRDPASRNRTFPSARCGRTVFLEWVQNYHVSTKLFWIFSLKEIRFFRTSKKVSKRLHFLYYLHIILTTRTIYILCF